MNLLATIDLAHVLACTAVPIAWGATVHWLFAIWPPRSVAEVDEPRAPLDLEADEANVP